MKTTHNVPLKALCLTLGVHFKDTHAWKYSNIIWYFARLFVSLQPTKLKYMEFREKMEQSQACLDSAESRQNSTFRQMRRKRQQLTEEESIAILQKATAGTLA